jgi:hypothetical protein
MGLITGIIDLDTYAGPGPGPAELQLSRVVGLSHRVASLIPTSDLIYDIFSCHGRISPPMPWKVQICTPNAHKRTSCRPLDDGKTLRVLPIQVASIGIVLFRLICRSLQLLALSHVLARYSRRNRLVSHWMATMEAKLATPASWS